MQISSGVRSGVLTASDMTVRVNSYYWIKSKVFSLISNRANTAAGVVEREVLIVEMMVTNNYATSVDLECDVRDSLGNIYEPRILGDITRAERLFLTILQPSEVRRGKMAFEVSENERGLRLHCGKQLETEIR